MRRQFLRGRQPRRRPLVLRLMMMTMIMVMVILVHRTRRVHGTTIITSVFCCGVGSSSVLRAWAFVTATTTAAVTWMSDHPTAFIFSCH